MHYKIIMTDGYGDTRIFQTKDYNFIVYRDIRKLFKRHTLFAVVSSSGGFIDKNVGWWMSKQDLLDQMYLSEWDHDDNDNGDDDWKQYKIEMKSFIEEHVIE